MSRDQDVGRRAKVCFPSVYVIEKRTAVGLLLIRHLETKKKAWERVLSSQPFSFNYLINFLATHFLF